MNSVNDVLDEIKTYFTESKFTREQLEFLVPVRQIIITIKVF